MQKKLLVVFNLKPGVEPRDYEAWARTKDLPTVNRLPSVSAFRVFRSTGLFGAEGTPPYAYCELIEVEDFDQFMTDISDDDMQAVAAEFQQLADMTFIEVEELEAER